MTPTSRRQWILQRLSTIGGFWSAEHYALPPHSRAPRQRLYKDINWIRDRFALSSWRFHRWQTNAGFAVILGDHNPRWDLRMRYKAKVALLGQKGLTYWGTG